MNTLLLSDQKDRYLLFALLDKFLNVVYQERVEVVEQAVEGQDGADRPFDGGPEEGREEKSRIGKAD